MSAAMSDEDGPVLESKRLLDPIDRISEILFGLLMAVTIVGSLSIATAGRDEVRTVLVGALGCNLAWGLVDAVMYLVRQLTEKTRKQALVRRLQSAGGKEVTWEVTPIIGTLFGRSRGLVPGVEASVAYKAFDVYVEAEYVFDRQSSSDDYSGAALCSQGR